MKKCKILSFALALGVMVNFASCANKEKSQKNNSNPIKVEDKKGNYPIEITTYNGKKGPIKETFKEAPKRVVAVYQSSIETLLALGQADKIVLASQLDTPVKDEYKEAFKKIKYMEKAPSKEEVLGVNPDFITSWASYFGEKKLGDGKDWINKNINIYVQANSGAVKPNSLENEYNDILNLGKIFNVEDKANSIVNNMKMEIEKAKKYVEGKKKVRTAILEVEKEGHYRVYGYDSIGGDIAKQVGADLVADKNGSIGKEDLIKLNPDVIFVVYFGDNKTAISEIQKITNDSALKNLVSVKNNRVKPIVLSEVYATGIRTLDGIKTITKGLYPDLK